MNPRHRFAGGAAGLVALVCLTGCELALHEVQQVGADGCDPWQTGCPPLVDYAGGMPARPSPISPDRLEIVRAAADAPYRRCDGIGLACQGRIIGDVLRDQYLMVLAGRSGASSTAASAGRVAGATAPGAEPTAVGAPASVAPQQPQAPARIVRTHGSRGGEAFAPASR